MDRKIAILTGAAGGIGREVARALRGQGFTIGLVDLDREGLDRLAASLPETIAFPADVTRIEEVRAVVAGMIERFGRIDLLVNNAGIVSTRPLDQRSREDIRRELDVNFQAALDFIHLVVPVMKKQGAGNIVTVCSLGGIVPLKESMIYCASKFALRGLMLPLHIDLKPHGIGVTNICPTAVDTMLLQREVEGGGSLLNFLGNPVAPARVAEAVLRAIEKSPIEIYVPWSEGLSSRLFAFFPWLMPPLIPLLEKLGRKNHRRYLERKGLAPGKEEP